MTFLPVFGLAGALISELGLTTSAPQPIVIGDIEEVPIAIELKETPDVEGRPLQYSVNAGRIEGLERVAPGKYSGRYILPATKFPQVAIFAWWFETGPDAEVNFARIPLFARTKLPHHAKAGSEVRVEVGKEVFGPAIADRKGNALVPIVVPPGVRDVVIVAGNDRTTFAVKVPKHNRLHMAVVPYKVPADGASATTVHAYYDAEVAPAISALKLQVPLGELKPLEGGSHFRIQYTPARTIADREVAVSAAIDFDPDAKASERLLIGKPVPAKILVHAADKKAEMGLKLEFDLSIVDDRGLGVPGQKVQATPSAGTIDAVNEAGYGRYVAVLTPPAERPFDGKVNVEFRIQNESGPMVSRIDATLPSESQVYVAQHKGELPPTGPSVFYMGARAGAAYEGAFSLLAGLEVAIRPRFLEQALDIRVNGSYRTVSQKFVVAGLMNAKVSSTLTRIPVTAGVTYAFVHSEDLRVYGGGSAGVAFLTQSISGDFSSQSLHHIDPTLELAGGVSFDNIFVELGAIIMPISTRELSGPAINFSGTLGYRLGI